MFGYTLIKYILGIWISSKYPPPKNGEYLCLGEYGIGTCYHKKGYGFAGDSDIGEITHYKRIIGIPNGKYKKYLGKDSNIT